MANPFKPNRVEKQRARAFRVYGELVQHAVDTGQVPSAEDEVDAFDDFCDRLLKTISIIDQRHQVTVMPAQLKKRIRERMDDIQWPTPPKPKTPSWEKN